MMMTIEAILLLLFNQWEIVGEGNDLKVMQLISVKVVIKSRPIVSKFLALASGPQPIQRGFLDSHLVFLPDKPQYGALTKESPVS